MGYKFYDILPAFESRRLQRDCCSGKVEEEMPSSLTRLAQSEIVICIKKYIILE